MLLILTSEKDLAADFLIVRLLERKLPYFRLNVEELHQKHCTVGVSSRGVTRTILNAEGRGIDLDSVSAVWYRRAIHPFVSPNIPPAQRNFVAGEFRHFWTGLMFAPDKLWVNPIDRVFVAEHKLFQLQVAQGLGLHVPRSVVSRNPEELRQFVHEVGSAICKPIFHGLFLDQTARYSIYTRRVTADSFDDIDSIDLCPVLLQEEIPRRADVRVTIIGEECFVANIESSNPSLIDWRQPGSDISYSPSTLPQEIESRCRAMMSKLGLHYGAFDFVQTPEGQLVFLEINPTGEWAWLEDRLGFPMRDAFIRLFFEGRT